METKGHVHKNKDCGLLESIDETSESDISDSTSLTSTTDESEVEARSNLVDNNPETLYKSVMTDQLFKGLTIYVGKVKSKRFLKNVIEALGGIPVPKDFSGTLDYAVVPIQEAPLPLELKAKKIVTNLYIEDCIKFNQFVKKQYYHEPFIIREPNIHPLSGCVVTIGRCNCREKRYLIALATELGAICQRAFTAKANEKVSKRACTHLICPYPIGRKYEAAVEWKLPVVTKDWLEACAAQSAIVDVTPFLVTEKTEVPDKIKTYKKKIHNIDISGTTWGPLTSQSVDENKENVTVMESVPLDFADCTGEFRELKLAKNRTSKHIKTRKKSSDGVKAKVASWMDQCNDASAFESVEIDCIENKQSSIKSNDEVE